MKIELNYLAARRVGYLYLWEINGKDKDNKAVNFYITHIKGKPTPDATYLEAENVSGEIENDTLVLLDEVILKCEKRWEYNPDRPRNLAKSVTVI